MSAVETRRFAILSRRLDPSHCRRHADMTALLVLATIVDLLLAGLLVNVSGFIFGGGPQGSGGGASGIAAWSACLFACLAAPILGWVLRRFGKAHIGVAVALLPAVAALVLAIVVYRPS